MRVSEIDDASIVECIPSEKESDMKEVPSKSGIRRRRLGLAMSKSPLRHLIRIYYGLSLWILSFFLRRSGEVCAIVLSGSAVRGTMRYGVSDIDFFVVIDSGPQSERIRDNIGVDLAFLRRFLLPLADADETGVLTVSDLHALRVTKPHLFDVKNQLRVLCTRADFDFEAVMDSQKGVESSPETVRMSQLSDVWRKFLVYLEHCAYDAVLAENVLSRVVERLREVVPVESDAADDPNAVFARFLDALGCSTSSRMGDHRVEVPNLLFRESLPLDIIRDFSSVPETMAIMRVSADARNESVPSLADLDVIRTKGEVDYVQVGSVLLPFVSEGAYGILTRDANPLTFAAMSGEDPPRGVISRMKSINEAQASHLAGDTGFIFLNDPSNLLFAVREVLHFLDRDSPERLDVVQHALDEGEKAEACFEAQAILRDTTRESYRVSVLIPTYNRVGLLRETIQSLLDQSRKPDEILVIDNGSTDDTADWIDGMSVEHQHLRRVLETEKGIIAARNRAIADADPDSDVVLFIDDDCLAPVDWVKDMMLPFEYDHEIVSCGGGISFRDDDCTPWGDFYRQKYRRESLESAR